MKANKKIYISFLVFGTISILFVGLVIYPLLREIRKNSKELLEQKNNLSSFSEGIKDLANSKKAYEVYRQNLEKIDTLFVDPEVPIELINSLEKNASDAQLLIDISPLPTVKKGTDPWPSLSFQISAVGSFPSSLQFLEKLENGPYLIDVLNLNLKRLTEKEIKEGAPLTSINAIFSIKVFTK